MEYKLTMGRLSCRIRELYTPTHHSILYFWERRSLSPPVTFSSTLGQSTKNITDSGIIQAGAALAIMGESSFQLNNPLSIVFVGFEDL